MTLLHMLRTRGVYITVATVMLLAGGVCTLLCPNSNFWQSIGTSLIASGIIALLDIWARFITAPEEELTSKLLKAGIRGIYEDRSLSEYKNAIENVTDTLQVAGYSLRSFYDSFHKTLEQRFNACNDVKVQLLLVDPSCEDSKNRETLEKHVEGTFEKSLQNLSVWAKERPQVEVRLLPFALTTMYFRIDRVIYVGPQFFSKASRSTITWKLERTTSAWMYTQFEEEFNYLWNSAKKIV